MERGREGGREGRKQRVSALSCRDVLLKAPKKVSVKARRMVGSGKGLNWLFSPQTTEHSLPHELSA